jgi:hypothetical protein
MLSAVTDSAGPLDQSEGMARQPIELCGLWRAASSVHRQQGCELRRVIWFPGRSNSLIAADGGERRLF